MDEEKYEYPDGIDKVTIDIFEEAEKNLPEKIRRYSNSIKRSLELRDMNIHEKALVAPTIHHGYINSLFKERNYLKRLEKAYTKKKDIIKEEFVDDGRPSFVVDREVKQRKDLQKIRDTIELQKELINYLEDCCKVLSQFGYSVKNAVELMKLM